MTLKEFYNEINGSYEEVLGRLMNDKRIYKYLFKFPASDDYKCFKEALAEEKWEEAFRFSHNLKGVCLNLGLGDLTTAAVDVCESLRKGKPEIDISGMLELLAEKYDEIVTKIGELDENAAG